MKENKLKNIIYSTIAIIFCIIYLFPCYWIFATSLKLEKDIFATPPSLFPNPVSFDNYVQQLSGEFSLINGFFNSFKIASGVMVLALILAVPAAYALARYRFKGKKLLILTFLVTQMLPSSLLLTPLFIIFNKLGLLNNHLSPMLAICNVALTFSVLTLRPYFLTIPKELEDSATVDGCNSFTSFIRIMLPIAVPGILVVAVFSFLFGWGDLIYSLTFLNTQQMRPMTAGIYNFITQYGIEWNKLMAFGALTVIPVIIIFVTLQKYIIGGLTNGAVKG